jgi:2,6-dihydroxypseudooxynicotine hydrolase
VTTTAAGARTREIVGHWYPRFLVAGVPYADLEECLARVDAGTPWLDSFLAAADRHAGQAEAALAAGHRLSAGEAWVRAAVLAHFGQFMAFDDAAAKAAAARRKVELYARAAPLLDPPAEPVRIPYGGHALTAYLRRPTGTAAVVPVVVLVPGSDSTKEEFDSLERVFLARGLATLSVDGPGQGEGRGVSALRPGWGPVLRAVVDHVAARGDLGTVGVLGMAFGGHLVLDGAGAVPEVAAVVAVNGFHDLGDFWDELPPVYRENLRHALDAADLAGAEELARGFSLRQVEVPGCPVLVVHGARDRIFPVSQAHAVADRLGERAELVVYPEGNHVCNNIPYRYRPLAADWLADRLTTTDAPEELP